MALTGAGGDAREALAFVLSLNLHRRHLNESQRAMVAVEVEKLYAAEAKERQREAGREKGKANLPEARQAREQAATALNVSARLVQDAKKVAKAAEARSRREAPRRPVAIPRTCTTLCERWPSEHRRTGPRRGGARRSRADCTRIRPASARQLPIN